jgi:tetratricopeptide (TPR) repeat protein
MIIVDGLDDRCGQTTVDGITKHISMLASTHQKHGVKAIILSRKSLHTKETKPKVFTITHDHTHNDIQHITKHSLHGCEHFEKHNEHEQEAIVEKLAHAAKGNFLWVQLVANKLKRATSHEAFTKAVNSAKESPKSVEELIHGLVSIATSEFTKPEAVQLLSWLLVSERPLTLVEIKGLVQVDLQKKTLVDRKGDIAEEINSSYGALLRVERNIVRFRHGAIREYLVTMQTKGDKFHTIPIAQTDFLKRILAYSKLRLKDPHSVSFEHPELPDIDNLFLHNGLLEYASRNWISHFHKSSFYKPTGSFGFPEDFKNIFPGSVQFAMTEWSCWSSQYSSFDIVKMYNLALRIREDIFTANHESVLQCLIFSGKLYRKLSNFTEAGTCFYRASRIGQSVLKAHSTITISCTTSFLEVTESVTSTTRTELVTRKEEMLQYVITACKHKYGKTSDMVIRYCRTLAEIYVSIHEEEKAETIWRELREIIVVRYGKGSAEETSVNELLNITLKPGHKHDEIIEYEKNIFDTSIEKTVWDIRRITITLKLAASYEARGDLLKAEELYVMLWGHIIDHCHQVHLHHLEFDVHISMIDIALEYVRFLRRGHRHEEAAGILICLWTEYEEYDFESETIFLRLKIVGELMRAISLLSVAVSVFKKCWSWFKAHGKTEHVSSCQILISETINEIITTETTTVSTSTTSTTTTETVIKEVFESTMSKSTVTIETISICQSLVAFYMKSEQWSEAIKTSKRSLELIWRMVLSTGGTIALPREFASEAIEIAIRLAICHHKSHHFHEAESIHLRIYRACFNSCHIQDERLTKAYNTLVKFYQEHGHWHKVVEIHQGVLVAYRKHLGASHAWTIKTLYTLGSLCSEHGHGHAHEYYEEIITVVNKSSKVCHHDALAAMKIMCRYYYEQGHWTQLKHTCELLWETFVHHHHEHKVDVEFFELLYMRYVYVLEHHSHASYEVIRTITIQYRDTCVAVFGASVAITIKALIELAQVSMRSEKYIHEAISYYEEVSTKLRFLLEL